MFTISKNIIVIIYYNNEGGTLILMRPFYYGDEKQNPNFGKIYIRHVKRTNQVNHLIKF